MPALASRKTRSSRSFILLAFLGSLLILILSLSSVHAQGDTPPSPSPEVPSPEPTAPATTDAPVVPSPTASPTGVVVTSTGTAPAATPTEPSPIFSNSDSCTTCHPSYEGIHTCSSRLPLVGNLTMINQVLPFYNCMCANSTLIDALQSCSICLRSTGQQAFLNRAFYNVTNQDVKAIKQVCNDTDNGTKIPSAALGDWDMLTSMASWGIISTVVLILLPLGGL